MNKKIIATSVIFLLIGMGIGHYATDYVNRSQINQLESEIDQLESEILGIELVNRISENVIERTTNIVAINEDEQGILATLTVDLTPGSGEIFVKSGPLIGFDFQNAQIDAVKAAANFTNLPIDNESKGIVNTHTHFKVSAETDEEITISRIDGPSAGASAAVATVAALNGENLRNDVVITGTISPKGSIGLVGGVLEKVKAAEDADMEFFLVPEGQTVNIDGEWKTISSLKSYASDKGWDLKIRKVSNLKEATEYFFE